MSTRRLGPALIVLLTFAFAVQVYAQEENLLQAPDFEGSFPGDEGDPMLVGEGWGGWYLDAPDDCRNQMPTFGPSIDIDERNHSGSQATQIGIRDATFTAGIYQVVEGVTPGETYKFSVWGHVLYATTPVAQASDGPDPRMRVGIDPTGGVNPFADTVHWGEVDWEFDTYYEFSVVAEAESDTVTVFTYSTQPECLASNFTFWDDAQLVATTEPVTPDEIPNNPNYFFRDIETDDIVKTSEDEFEVGATVSVSGSASGDEEGEGEESETSDGASAGGTGSICLLMFQDANGNGSREVEEMKLAGGVFTLTDGSQVVGTYTTDGLSEPYCFSSLAPGNYMLTWRSEGYEGSNAEGWAVTLTQGETLSREFGAIAAADAEEGESGFSVGRLLRSLAIAGGVVIFLLAVGVGVFFVLSRRGSDDEDDESAPPPDPFDEHDETETREHRRPGADDTWIHGGGASNGS